MQLHHKKHHQTYVTNLNMLTEKLAESTQKSDLSSQIALQPAYKFNAGGHLNHSIFWTNLAPPTSAAVQEGPKGHLLHALEKEFGGVEAFKQKFSAMSVGVQGSGWGWLGWDTQQKRLVMASTANQDPLIVYGQHLVPLLGIDVWEHAYYLQYKNVRPDYVKQIWNVVNWQNVSERYIAAST
jgi:superoxide dismutase, Fe-Mn family